MYYSEESEKTFVHQIMRDNIIKVNSSSIASDISKLMIKKRISSVAVTGESDKIIGIITERDLVGSICAKDILASSLTAEKVMSSPLLTIDKGSTIKEAVKFMVDKRIRHLAVSDGNDILGIVTTTDVINDLKSKIKQNLKFDSNILDMITMADIPLEEGGFSLPLDEDNLNNKENTILYSILKVPISILDYSSKLFSNI